MTQSLSGLRLVPLGLLGLALSACDGNGRGGPTTPTTDAGIVVLSDFRVRPLGTVFADRDATLEITVRASDPSRLVGTRAIIRRLLAGAQQVRAGQVGDVAPIISSVEVTGSHLLGDLIRLLMPVRLPLGTSRLRFQMLSPFLVFQTARGGQSASGRPVITNAIDFQIEAREVQPPPPPAPPCATISGTPSTIFEENQTSATLTVSLAAAAQAPVLVQYALGGTAILNQDYSVSPTPAGSVTIPAGASSAVVTVQALDDRQADSGETVTVTLLPGPGYTVCSPSTFSLTIADNDD